MVVCKYFLEGTCKFGQNCRFEHIYGGDRGQQSNVYGSYNLKQICKMLEQEIITTEKGGQWPLSSFSPFKESICFPGWEDVSPEEVRWMMYDARQQGTLDQCLSHVMQLYKSAEQRRNEIKQPTQETLSVIENLSKGKSSSSFPTSGNQSVNIFGSTPSQALPPAASFRFEVPTTQPSFPVFSVFPTTETTTQASPFFPANTTTQNVFQMPQNMSKNIFGAIQNNDLSQNAFSNKFGVSPNSAFSANTSSKNIFQTQNQPTVNSSNPFQRPVSNQETMHVNKQPDLSIYSKMEDLTEEEKRVFMAPTFSFGKIPVKPPPLQFC